jgi:Uma2 family endonuclease
MSNGLGWVAPEGTSLRCFPERPNLVRKPDGCFHRIDRLDPTLASTQGHLTVAPDLVVEVISPHDRAYRVSEKLGEWQDAGVPLVWLVYPNRRAVLAYHIDTGVREFRRNDTLTADPVLPGFAVPVAELFRLPA